MRRAGERKLRRAVMRRRWTSASCSRSAPVQKLGVADNGSKPSEPYASLLRKRDDRVQRQKTALAQKSGVGMPCALPLD